MDEQRKQDEMLLIDYLMARCDEAAGREVELRLEKEPEFRALRDQIANSLGALKLIAPPVVSDDLADRTLARIASARKSTAASTRRELGQTARTTFSMRELGTLAAAVIIMAVLFIPWAREVRNRSLQNKCASSVGQIGTGMKNYAMDNMDSLPIANASSNAWLPGAGRKSASNSAGLFHLVSDDYAPVGVFQCPADQRSAETPLSVNGNMTDFPAAKYISYSYQHALGQVSLSRNDRKLASVASEMAVLSDQTPIFEDGRFQASAFSSPRQSSRNHGSRGQNVLYLDWTVRWSDRATVGVDGDNIFLVQGKQDYDGTEAPASVTDSFLLPAWSGSSPDGR